MYDFAHLDVSALLRAKGSQPYTFDMEKNLRTAKSKLESEYFGMCVIDIYNLALHFKEMNIAKDQSKYLT